MSEPQPKSFITAFHSAKQNETTRLAAAKAAVAAACTALDSSVDAAPDGYVGLLFQMAAELRSADLKDIRVGVAAGKRRKDLTDQTVIEREIFIWFDGRPTDGATHPDAPARRRLGEMRFRAFHCPASGKLLEFYMDDIPQWLSVQKAVDPRNFPEVLGSIAAQAGRAIARLAAQAT